jgi:hypothetical protein
MEIHLDTDNLEDDTKLIILQYYLMKNDSKLTFYSTKNHKPDYKNLFPPGNNNNVSELKVAPPDDRPLGDSIGILLAHLGSQSWCCTGIMVSPDLFLTNWHCGGSSSTGWEQKTCDNSLIDLSWDNDDISRDFQCLSIISQSKSRDFAILKVTPLNGATAPNPLKISERTIKDIKDNDKKI